MSNQLVPFKPGCFLHLYNHGNGDDNIFREEENYHYFLNKYKEHISPVADTYSYNLMPNHFHFLLRILDENELIKTLSISDLPGFTKLERLVSKKFSNLFNAYSKAFNKKYERVGKLFRSGVKRKKITSDDYLSSVIHYIHYNAAHHGFVKDFRDWKYSSFNIILSGDNSWIKTREVLDWFGGRDEFEKFHKWDSDLNLEWD